MENSCIWLVLSLKISVVLVLGFLTEVVCDSWYFTFSRWLCVDTVWKTGPAQSSVQLYKQ